MKSGVHTIGLVYSGDDNYTGVNKSVELIIIDDSTESKQTANITVNITDNPVEGDDVLVNVTLDGNVTGMVNIIVDDAVHMIELVDGAAVYTILNVTRGNHTIAVVYFGDNNYNNATLNVTFSVSEDASYIDPDTAFINPDKDNPTLFAVDLPVNATGNFTILVDGKEYQCVHLVDGKANITVSGLSDGSHDISMLYSGDGYYKPIGKSTSIFVINDGSSGGGSVSPGDADSVFNLTGVNATPAVFSINLPCNATGNFTVSIGGKDYTKAVVNGSANITVNDLVSGLSSVVVSYSGDDYYDSLFKTATVNIPVKPTPSHSPAPSKVTSVFKLLSAKKYTFKVSKATKKVKVTLQTPNSVKVAKVSVVFKFNKKALKKLKAKNKKGKKLLKKLKKGYSVKTNAKGVATLKLKNKLLTFKKGKLAFTVTFNGYNQYNKATGKEKIKIK